ncbi:MAG: phasin family protein [Bauldia sp.]|nr:phasin family protein [Bauldia sp.]
MIGGFDEFQKVGKDGMDNVVKSAGVWSKGWQTLAAESADYSRSAFESGAKAFEKLVAAPSLDKAVEIQADYFRSAYENYVGQATKVSEIFAAMTRDAYKPYEGMLGKIGK